MESQAIHRTLGVGEMLNWYRIERVLGRGGFGVIYLATDTNLDCPVAIKEYLPPEVARRAGDTTIEPLTGRRGELYRWGLDRFIKEARNLVRFKHPNIVRVMSVFQQNNTAYMVMEFEAGETLVRHLERAGSVTETRLRALAEPLADGLDEVHRHGFIHRDIKPANILMRPDRSPVLLDFGSARNAAVTGGEGMTALVSAGYAPMEQYDDGDDEQQGPWTDIYALGGVLYYAISGADPVDGARRAAALLNGARDPLIPATVMGAGRYSRGFLAAIDWALEHRIADRPQTLADWRPALLGDAVAVDAEARRRALREAAPAPVTARRTRRFRDPDDFGEPRETARPDTAGPGTSRTAGERPAARRQASPGTQRGVEPRPDGPRRDSTGRPSTERPPTVRVRRRDRLGAVLSRTASGAADPGGISRARAVVATSVLLGGIGVLWFASEQSSDAANAARDRAAVEARALREGTGGDGVRDEPATPRPDDGAVAGAVAGASLAVRGTDESANAGVDAGVERERAAREADRAATTEAAAQEARRAEAARQEAERAETARVEAARAIARAEAEALRTRQARLAEEAVWRRERETALDARHDAALDTASRALAAGRLDAMADALDEARGTAREGARFDALLASLEAARAERARPVSDEQFEAVVRRFDGLKRAIEAKDVAIIEALTVPGAQNALFTQLMSSFETLNMEITGIRVRNADKSVTANLRIRDMRRPNGDRAVPSPAYRDRDITSRLVNGVWSRVTW